MIDSVTAEPRASRDPEAEAPSTRVALEALIRRSGLRPVASIEDLGRFRGDLWESDEELAAFLADVNTAGTLTSPESLSVVVLDTDVASRLQKGQLTRAVSDTLVGATIALTFVTVAELFKWAEVRSWGSPRRAKLERWLDPDLCYRWIEGCGGSGGLLAAASEGRGRPARQRHVGRCLLPCCRATACDLQPRRLRGLREVPRAPDAPHRLGVLTGSELVPPFSTHIGHFAPNPLPRSGCTGPDQESCGPGKGPAKPLYSGSISLAASSPLNLRNAGQTATRPSRRPAGGGETLGVSSAETGNRTESASPKVRLAPTSSRRQSGSTSSISGSNPAVRP